MEWIVITTNNGFYSCILKLLWGTGPSGIGVYPLVFLCIVMVLEMDNSTLWLIMKCLNFWIAWRVLVLTTGKSVSTSPLLHCQRNKHWDTNQGYGWRLCCLSICTDFHLSSDICFSDNYLHDFRYFICNVIGKFLVHAPHDCHTCVHIHSGHSWWMWYFTFGPLVDHSLIVTCLVRPFVFFYFSLLKGSCPVTYIYNILLWNLAVAVT